ncbi:laccase 8 [Tricholoma matsutake]|nr:laccase 8 [Tricholoma matsutake 945]
MLRGLLVLSLSASIFLCAAAMITLDIGNKFISPDGLKRSTVLANGQYPGPLLKGFKGDRFRINVVNNLTDDTMQRSTSIHWHGIFQKGTNYADGPAGVSQCPISPSHSFLYDFSVPDQVGTFWYHSHFSTQYCDGLRGPFVVYDPLDPHQHLYDVDDESTIITVSEWYHLPAPTLETQFAFSNSTLINGKGRYPGGPKAALAIVNVVQGKRYRFRLVSISCDPSHVFSIDSHQLMIIEADGENTKPSTVDILEIFAGQRYSFVLIANQPVDNYWIRALTSSGNGELPNGFAGGINSAILRYKGASVTDPISSQTTNGIRLVETNLHPLDDLTAAAPGLPFPGGADININLNITPDLINAVFLINGKTFTPPPVPVLLQILSGAKSAQDLLPSGSIYGLQRNKVVEVTVPGGSIASPHPFHLHGHSFSVVRSEGADTKPNYLNPMRRDVVSTGNIGSNVTIRFVTDNAGPWLFHCHIDWHLKFGLAVVFAEDIADTPELDEPTEAWKYLCPIFDSLKPSQTSIQIVTAMPPP